VLIIGPARQNDTQWVYIWPCRKFSYSWDIHLENIVYDKVFQTEQNHWWFRTKRQLVLSLLKQHIVTSPQQSARICDIGCGCGMMLQELKAADYDGVGIDASDMALDYCRQRGVQAVKGLLPANVNLSDESVDGVLVLDVLEHIEDDGEAWAAAMKLLKPDGIAICTVPACSWLWTQNDEYLQHKRRYNYHQLSSVVKSVQNTEVLCLTYINTFLFPLALIERMALKLLPFRKETTGLAIPAWGVNYLLHKIYSAEIPLINFGIRFPVGLSLLAVVRKS